MRENCYQLQFRLRLGHNPTYQYPPSSSFLAPLPGTLELQKGESRDLNHFTLFFSCLVYFLFCLFTYLIILKPPKISVVFIFVLLICFFNMSSTENTKLCDFTSTNNNDFICSPIAPPALKLHKKISPRQLRQCLSSSFLAPLPWTLELQQGESHTLNLFTMFLFCLLYFSFSLFSCFQNFKTQKKLV